MNNLFRLGVAAVALLFLSGFIAPAATFMQEIMSRPDLIGLTVTQETLNNSAVVLVFSMTYRGSVPLKDVRLEVLNETLYFGDLRKDSTVSRRLLTEVSRLAGLSEFKVSFSVAGIYGVELRIRGAR